MSERKTLRIAMISLSLPSTSKIGVGYQVHELASEMSRRGHHVDVYSTSPPVADAVYGHHLVAPTGSMRTFKFALMLRRIDFSSYDVIHAHGHDYWLWRRRAPRHIRTMHGSCFEEAIHIRGLGERLRMFALGLSEILSTLVADQTVLVSPQTRKWYPWVSRVIPNGVDSIRFTPAPERRASEPVILFVGTWSNRKRGSMLAEAFTADVLPRIPGARLEMVCRDAPSDPGKNVQILGHLSDAELAEAYQRAWVFCLPSTYEGFGIPYAEAMMSGLPVVATPNPGARYVTEDGRFGEIVADDDLGTTLAAILDDPKKRDQLSAQGRQRAEDFALSNVAAQYEEMYR